MAKAFKVKLVRSLIGRNQKVKDTVRCLGLRKLNHEVTVKDTPAQRGAIFKIQHMLEVTPVND